MSTPTAPRTRKPQYAGLGLRFLALAIDLVILSMVFFPLTRIVKGVWIMSSTDHLWGYGWLITDPLCIAFLVAIFIYFVMMEGFLGATVGKLVLRLRVVGDNGSNPGVARALVRNLLRLVDGLPAFNILGVVLILSSPQKARFGDRIAGTRVVIRNTG
ncbi:MAG: RDD family protein [Candidatus Zixiibacteriota bacterium]|nr:MAG: RDD family protein [candidate division Zixibacteria bacterium]